MSGLRAKRTVTSLNRLRNMGLNTTAETKFILEPNIFDDEGNEPPPNDNWIINGRLLLNSPTYKDGAVRLQIIIGTDFPVEPPKVCVKTPIYHPNVSKEGEVCIDVLSKNGTWTPTTTLDAAILEVAHVIDNPSIDRIQYTEAASLWNTNKAEYEKKAREVFINGCAPRT